MHERGGARTAERYPGTVRNPAEPRHPGADAWLTVDLIGSFRANSGTPVHPVASRPALPNLISDCNWSSRRLWDFVIVLAATANHSRLTHSRRESTSVTTRRADHHRPLCPGPDGLQRFRPVSSTTRPRPVGEMAVTRHCRPRNNDLAPGSRNSPPTGGTHMPRTVGGRGHRLPNLLLCHRKPPEARLAGAPIRLAYHWIRRMPSTGLFAVNMAG